MVLVMLAVLMQAYSLQCFHLTCMPYDSRLLSRTGAGYFTKFKLSRQLLLTAPIRSQSAYSCKCRAWLKACCCAALLMGQTVVHR